MIAERKNGADCCKIVVEKSAEREFADKISCRNFSCNDSEMFNEIKLII